MYLSDDIMIYDVAYVYLEWFIYLYIYFYVAKLSRRFCVSSATGEGVQKLIFLPNFDGIARESQLSRHPGGMHRISWNLTGAPENCDELTCLNPCK